VPHSRDLCQQPCPQTNMGVAFSRDLIKCASQLLFLSKYL
jgi:hypothetical protein